MKPSYVQCSVNVVPFNVGGLTWDDGILTWSCEEGFWMQGNLDEKVWKRLGELREGYCQ